MLARAHKLAFGAQVKLTFAFLLGTWVWLLSDIVLCTTMSANLAFFLVMTLSTQTQASLCRGAVRCTPKREKLLACTLSLALKLTSAAADGRVPLKIHSVTAGELTFASVITRFTDFKLGVCQLTSTSANGALLFTRGIFGLNFFWKEFSETFFTVPAMAGLRRLFGPVSSFAITIGRCGGSGRRADARATDISEATNDNKHATDTRRGRSRCRSEP